LRALVEVTVWWAVLVLVWIATLTTVTVQELVAAGVLAVPCALVARLGRRAIGVSWPMRARWLLWLRKLPWAVLHDTAAVLALAVRPSRSDRFREVPLPDDAAQEAVATVLLSTAPGSVVVDVQDHRLLVHELTGTGLDQTVRK
jgi:multisubunit Na+/H+ antiporter MnhE subunit